MSPIKDLQRRGTVIGSIRLGMKVERDGKQVPTKLTAFRFTTNSKRAADQVAHLYGGEVIDWPGGTHRYQVITNATEIGVMVPPGQAFVTQWWEMWTAAGCARRCDGELATMFADGGSSQQPCACPADLGQRAVAAALRTPRACKPTTRLAIVHPDLPDLGTWQLVSTGMNAALELGDKARVLELSRDAGQMLPAVLRADARTTLVPGEAARHYVVPVLEIGATLRELMTGQVPATTLPPVPDRLAIEAGPTQTPAGAPPLPVGGAPAGPDPAPAAAAAPSDAAGTGPAPAQQIADRAAAATDAPSVLAMGKAAKADGLFDQRITVAGEPGKLGDYLVWRHGQLDVVDAELVDDEDLDGADLGASDG